MFRTTPTTLSALALLLATMPAAAADGSEWDRASEEQFRTNAETHATGHATLGALYTASVDELRALGHLRVIENATHENVTYDVLVVRTYGCEPLVRIDGLSIPGYDVLDELANASGMTRDAGALELRACGEHVAGIPAGSGATRGGGTLRVATGNDTNMRVRHGFVSNSFEMWVGLVIEETLEVTRLVSGSYAVDTTAIVSVVVLGDLDHGSGSVRIDMIPAWHRTIFAARVDGFSSENDLTLGEHRPATDALDDSAEPLAPWLEQRHDTRRYCGAVMDPTSPPCETLARAIAGPALVADRATDAWREAPRFDRAASAAARYDGLCHGIGSGCLFAPGGAKGIRLGTLDVAVDDRTEPWTTGPGGSIDRRVSEERARLETASLVDDGGAWFLSLFQND